MEKESMMNLALQSSNKPQTQAVDFMQNCNPIITISLHEVNASISSITNLRGEKETYIASQPQNFKSHL